MKKLAMKKLGRTAAATVALGGGLVCGLLIGSSTGTNRGPAPAAPTVAQVTEPVAIAESKSVTPRRVARRTRPAPVATEAPKLVMTIPVTAPELHDRLKPVLAKGTKMNLAVAGFSDAEQFATLAHAARTTQVPFILLKHRVLTEGQSLADAIRASKPDMDAAAEAERAKKAAKADIAALNTAA